MFYEDCSPLLPIKDASVADHSDSEKEKYTNYWQHPVIAVFINVFHRNFAQVETSLLQACWNLSKSRYQDAFTSLALGCWDCYKLSTGLVQVAVSDLSSFVKNKLVAGSYKSEKTNCNLRNISSGLSLPKPRANNTKNSFMYDGAHQWNTIQKEIRESKTTSSFKKQNRCAHHWHGVQYM